MNKELLTIGTVVQLKNANHAIMIIGFFPQAKERIENKVYDYLGCHFPEGLEDTTKSLVFNEDDIDKILHVSYSDNLDKAFRKQLLLDKAKIIQEVEEIHE